MLLLLSSKMAVILSSLLSQWIYIKIIKIQHPSVKYKKNNTQLLPSRTTTSDNQTVLPILLLPKLFAAGWHRNLPARKYKQLNISLLGTLLKAWHCSRNLTYWPETAVTTCGVTIFEIKAKWHRVMEAEDSGGSMKRVQEKRRTCLGRLVCLAWWPINLFQSKSHWWRQVCERLDSWCLYSLSQTFSQVQTFIERRGGVGLHTHKSQVFAQTLGICRKNNLVTRHYKKL